METRNLQGIMLRVIRVAIVAMATLLWTPAFGFGSYGQLDTIRDERDSSQLQAQASDLVSIAYRFASGRDAYEVVEGIDGSLAYDYIDGGFVSWFRYYGMSAEQGDRLVCTYGDGSETTYEYRLDDYWCFVNVDDDQDTIELWDVEMVDDQSYGHRWSADAAGHVTITYSDRSCTVPAHVVANPIKAIAYEPKEPLVLMEGVDSTDQTYFDGEGNERTWPLFWYEFPNPGDILTITTAEGDCDYTYQRTDNGEHASYEFVSEVGDKLPFTTYECVSDEQSREHPWTTDGGGTITVTYRQRACAVPVRIVPNAVSEIAFEPKDDHVLYQHIDSIEVPRDDGTLWESFSDARLLSGDKLIVSFVDGTSKTYVFDEGQEAFCNSEDASDMLPSNMVSVGLEQSSDKPLALGVNKGVGSVRYSSRTAFFDVTVRKNPVTSIAYTTSEPIIFVEGEDGDEMTDDAGEKYRFYTRAMCEGDAVEVRFDDGSALTYEFRSSVYGGGGVFVTSKNSILGDYLIVSEGLQSDQKSHHWEVGTHAYTVEYDGMTCEVPCEVRASGSDRRISLDEVTFEPMPDQHYTGFAVNPAVKATMHGTRLHLGSDIEMTCVNNVEPGIASATITGVGNYVGTKTLTFNIVEDYTVRDGVVTFADANLPNASLLSFDLPEGATLGGLVAGGSERETFDLKNDAATITRGHDYYLWPDSTTHVMLTPAPGTAFDAWRLEPSDAGTLIMTEEDGIFHVSLNKPATLEVTSKPVTYVNIATDEGTHVLLDVPSDIADKFLGLTFEVEPITDEGRVNGALALVARDGEGPNEIALYNLHLVDVEGNKFDTSTMRLQASEAMRVSIPTPEGWNARRVSVCHLDDDSARDMNGAISADGRHLVFYTTHLGDFALVLDGQAESDESESPFVDVVKTPKETAHYDDILWLASEGISEGWQEEDGTRTFRPNEPVKRGDMAAFLFRLAKKWGVVSESWQPTGSKTFSDVSSATSHRREILWLAETGVSTGWKVGSTAEFRPNEPVKRGDMAAFMRRLAKVAKRGGGASSSQAFFRDVTATTTFHDEIWWLAGNGVTQGWTVTGGREFRPNEPVKRGDMAAFLHRLDGVK